MKTRVKIIVSILLVILAIGDVYAILRMTWQASVLLRVGELTPRSADISLRCSPSMIVYGATTTIGGQLHNATSEVEIPYQTLAIYYRPSFGASWTYVTSVSTAFDGSFSYYWSGSASLAPGPYVVNATFAGNGAFDPWSSRTDLRVVIPPPPPTLVSPGASTSPGEEIYTLRPTFTWTSAPGADEYGLYIRDMDSYELIFDSQVRGRTITGTSYTLLPGVLQWGGHYRWNMNSHNEAGWGEYCSPLYLQTTPNQPPTCAIELQEDGVEISEIGVWEFFDTYVGDSTDDSGITHVRFASDNVQDNYPTGAWTRWFDWEISSEDWNSATKIKSWAFDTPGYKEVWAEVKDEFDQTAICPAIIFVPAPALPVLTSPLTMTPVKDVYNVGDSLDAEFTIENFGEIPITLDVLTVGGRLNGFAAPEEAPDFTFRSVTLQPNVAYQYYGSLTLTQTGNYRFFVAYYIENPTSNEERLLDESNWNTCVELGEELTHADRVRNIIVFDEDVVPEDVAQLRSTINRLKGLPANIPPYLLDDESFGGSAATLWMYWKSFFTDSWEMYDMHYFAGLDYENLRVLCLIMAGHDLDRGDIDGARKLVQTSIECGELSVKSFYGAFEVYDRNMEEAMWVADWVKDRCMAMVVAGVTVWNPTAGKVLDYAFVIVDYVINRELVGEDEATLLLVRDAAVTVFYNEVPFCDGMALSDYVKTHPAFKFTKLQNFLMNSPTLPDELHQALQEYIAEEVQNLSIEISNLLRNSIESVYKEVFSPVKPRIYDSEGRITGLVNGSVSHGIPRSVYFNETITIYMPMDTYRFEVEGTEEGAYRLGISSFRNGSSTTFVAEAMPTSAKEVHQYTVDWTAVALGGAGVDVQVDSEGDGWFEHQFLSDAALNGTEFVQVIAHDVAIAGLSTMKSGCLPKETVAEGRTLAINVTVQNQGLSPETFNVTLYANATLIGSQQCTLSPGTSSIAAFYWNTAGCAKGNYLIRAISDVMTNETDTADNDADYGYTHLTLAGDIDGDRDVDIFDMVRMAGVYGISRPDPRYNPNCDIDGDGDIDIFDLVTAAGNYGESW